MPCRGKLVGTCLGGHTQQVLLVVSPLCLLGLLVLASIVGHTLLLYGVADVSAVCAHVTAAEVH